jgi:hypothetical protein
MMSSRNVKSGRIFANPPTPVPEDKEVNSTHRPSEDSFVSGRNSSNRSSFEKSSRIAKSRGSNLIRQPSIRRSAMITSGTTAHMRARSPSLSSVGSPYMVQKPPFPVPTRSSSRTVGLSKSEGSQSPTPRSSGAFSGRRPYGTRQHQRKDSLRKVQSAAVIQKRRARSRSPPLPEPPVMPPSPELPPLPTDSVTGHMLGHRSQLSTQTAQTTYTASGSVGSSSYQTSVVDAIAATMVGEWMWKYVRKRKAFGGPESPADLARAEESASSASNGVRHKRWVWISPYERSVLWSSKQPTTSSALIGKSGRKRKLAIFARCYLSRLLTPYSYDSISPRCCGQHAHSPQCWCPAVVQPVYPDPHTSSSSQVHCRFSRAPLSMADGAFFPGALKFAHP